MTRFGKEFEGKLKNFVLGVGSDGIKQKNGN
jgi:hypothetical protein